MICSKCGAQNMDGVSFCGNCGNRMEVVPSLKDEQSEQPVVGGQYGTGTVAGQTTDGYTESGQANAGGGQPANNPVVTYTTPTGGPSNGGVIPPKNYMVESIIVTVVSFLCCCSPISIILGIIAIVKANSVNSEFERGNLNEAISNSESAKKLTIWAAVICVAFTLLWVIMYFLFLGAAITEAGGLDALLDM